MTGHFSILLIACATLGSLTSCAPTTPATPFGQFDLGTSSTFDFLSTVLLDEAKDPTQVANEEAKDVGFQIAATLQVASLWHNPADHNDKLLQLQLKKPFLHIKSRKAPSPDGFVTHTSNLESLKNNPFLVHWNNGEVKHLYVTEDETLSLVNLKRGVASLFQFRTFDMEAKETDVSGFCDVKYATNDGLKIEKIKSNCVAHKGVVPFMLHPDKVFGLHVNGNRKTKYVLKNDGSAVESITSSDYHEMFVIVRQEAGGAVSASQELKLTDISNSAKPIKADTLDDAVKQIGTKIGAKLAKKEILLEQEPPNCQDDCPTFAKVIRDNKENLKTSTLGSIKSASSFIKAVKIARNSKKADLVKVLNHAKYIELLPQLIDIIAAAQTVEAHNAAVEVLDFGSDGAIDLPERYLWSLSFGSQPIESVIRDLLGRTQQNVPSQKLSETLSLTVTGMTSKWLKLPGNAKKALKDDVRNWLLKKLRACDESDEECKLTNIRALKNLALPETIPTLIDLVKTGTKKICVESMKAIYGMPKSAWDIKVRDLCLRVYLQLGRRYDSSARTLAIDLLFEAGVSKEELQEMIRAMKHFITRECQEVGQYLLQRLRQVAEKQKNLVAMFKTVLLEEELNNYHVLGQRGMATAFTRDFLNTPSSNGSLVSTLELAGGILKRSVLDVVIEGGDESTAIFTMGMFAGGLSSFVTTDDAAAPPEEEESANAGMELTVMGIQVRPFVFFEGQGELMGHVWSGTGSERTPAFQALMLLHDHFELINLQNGLVAELSMTGGMSFDLAGEVQLSLWNRNAHSVVEKNAGVVMQGIITVDTSFVKSMVDFNIAMEPKLNLVSDVNFYNKVALCLQLSQPDSTVKHNIHKVERIPGSKHKLRKSKYKTFQVPGKTYALNQKNNEMCNSLFSDAQ
ncbi:microsomal triacylglycerol transfer protein [Neocloeon triangulifer]|uniref:microsomal triacylglycerol transfer protein n=1 Tax=Neocloeon triangulifer TaxID=2078957 RepID=UPI00286F7E5D|nr:microsomal triacylglycerol transfer protein [Neocloeon triangulifer]